MKNVLFFALTLFVTIASAQNEITYPYNPDSDGDQYVSVSDVLSSVSSFGSEFNPAEIQIDGVGLAEVISTLQATVEAQQTYINQLQEYISIEAETVLISGANLQVVSGSGETAEAVNGTGNIIIGYDEDSNSDKSGSHNLVVGFGHTYSSYGGIVAGSNNSITGDYSSVSGGRYNTASGLMSSVSGGYGNSASGYLSSVSGGNSNNASGEASSVLGGHTNNSFGSFSSVSGGFENTASPNYSTVSGDSGSTFLDNSTDGHTID